MAITRTYYAPFELKNGRGWAFESTTRGTGVNGSPWTSTYTISGFVSEAEALARIETLKQADAKA